MFTSRLTHLYCIFKNLTHVFLTQRSKFHHQLRFITKHIPKRYIKTHLVFTLRVQTRWKKTQINPFTGCTKFLRQKFVKYLFFIPPMLRFEDFHSHNIMSPEETSTLLDNNNVFDVSPMCSPSRTNLHFSLVIRLWKN